MTKIFYSSKTRVKAKMSFNYLRYLFKAVAPATVYIIKISSLSQAFLQTRGKHMKTVFFLFIFTWSKKKQTPLAIKVDSFSQK